MSDMDTKVIGYYAYLTKDKVICTDNQACLIAGSEANMKKFIECMAPGDAKKCIIRKTRFVDIKKGLYLGASYAFDKESYPRFYPLALKEGFNVQQADFESEESRDFFTVQIQK